MSAAGWEAVIGLEIHVQLATRTKIFCATEASRDGAEPNTLVDPVTLGMPGVLPVLNREVVELAIRLGLALGCTIAPRSRFSRKHYFYPDLPKGYQISQYDEPLCTGGAIVTEVDGEERRFRLTRIHLEEDAGKTVHDALRNRSLVDYNRAGVPLVETVSEPDLRSPADAMAYMKAMHRIVTALGVSDGNMEQGNFRCDANVSVRRVGDPRLGTKVELKNINSFRFVGRGLEHEIARQVDVLEAGGHLVQETRLWDEAAGVTRPMRTKEMAHDYRYFPDPDLMVLEVDEAWIERVRATLPELPRARTQRFVDALGLSAYDADVLTQSAARADYFEAVAQAVGDPKLAANWIQGELLGLLNKDGLDIEASPVPAERLAELLVLLRDERLSSKMAKACFAEMFSSSVAPADWLAAHGAQITDEDTLRAMVAAALDAHPDEVAGFHAGKAQLLGFFVGQVMKQSRGKANPQRVNQLVRSQLEERR
ncbi:MAG: Asp-tRNA(Asn)/Glu-tRNA(Gln) amidotransferase subunit GatB [Deltaproteobacteria bacterium]|nr:Asp-tRNA(Asn)/Glu-tRNA(Gln) amidotransferase subunit GatB [Deltaproteobacteria bacterium]MCB9785566.1 Asp-tRNA(Asn)/Glu-tRNA(Gln) amidotransferase subunit GatB [Deltaproteobacteria bacterium]